MSVNSVSSSTLSSILQTTVSRLQSQLSTAETETSTGMVADIGLTLGAESGQEIALHQQLADLNAISSSNSVVSSQLSTASDALTSLQSTASSMLNSLIEGQSETSGGSGAIALQQQASSALQTFASLANSTVGDVYVFAGTNTAVAPIASYAQTPASAAQTAVETAFQTYFGFSASSSSVSTITASQMEGFLDGPFAALFSGSSWTADWSSASDTPTSARIGSNQTIDASVTANQSGFQDMARSLTMVSEFAGLKLSSDAYAALMDSAQKAMTSASNTLIQSGAEVGAMQNAVSQSSSTITLQQNVLTTRINAKETVNAYDVASQVTNLSNQLQTAFSLTSQLHKLSLVNFL